MRRPSFIPTLCSALACLATAASTFAGFSATEVFLPAVGAAPGVAPAVWYTTVWVHNPGTTRADVTFYLLERTANLSPRTATDSIPPGDTRRYDNVVENLFGVRTFGALRITSNVRVMVGSRIYSQPGAALEDSTGQYFAGIPASFSIASGESTEIIGGWQTQPAADSSFRFNYGFVETTGTGTCQVQVTVTDEDGTTLGSRSYTVRQWEQVQRGLKDDFPAISDDNVRLTVEVMPGSSGRIIAFGSSVANGSQDPSTLEMLYSGDQADGSSVVHDATLIGNGTGSSPLGLADDAVSLPKLATTNAPTDSASGAAVHAALPRVLGTNGSDLFWTDLAGSIGLATGGVTFGDASGNLGQDATNLFWNSTTHRLGIGTPTPSEQLELTGNLKLTTTTATTGQLRIGDALLLHAFGTDNLFVGPGAGNIVTVSGNQNTGVGVGTLQNLVSAWNNTAVGYHALASHTDASGETAVGANALTASTGWGNVAIGSHSMTANTEGIRNTAIGTRALAANTTGNQNSAVGFRALFQSSTASYNTAVGDLAMWTNETGEDNVAIGVEALYSNLDGHRNCAVGRSALFNTSADDNTALGWGSLVSNTTGRGNVAVGMNAGQALVSGERNVYIAADAGAADEAGTIRIGTTGTHTRAFIQGISGAMVAGADPVYVQADGQLGTLVPSSLRFKEAIEDLGVASRSLERLRPVRFRYRREIDPSGAVQFGLIAEEVADVLPELVVFSPSGEPEGVRYQLLSVLLLGELQQQVRESQRQAELIAELAHRLETLAAEVEAIAAHQR